MKPDDNDPIQRAIEAANLSNKPSSPLVRQVMAKALHKAGVKHNDVQKVNAANWLAKKAYSDTVKAAIAKAQANRELETMKADDGAEAYAYPHPRGIAWGVNVAQTGVNILRGVRRPDGADEGVN